MLGSGAAPASASTVAELAVCALRLASAFLCGRLPTPRAVVLRKGNTSEACWLLLLLLNLQPGEGLQAEAGMAAISDVTGRTVLAACVWWGRHGDLCFADSVPLLHMQQSTSGVRWTLP